jgi:hypothetical protein
MTTPTPPHSHGFTMPSGLRVNFTVSRIPAQLVSTGPNASSQAGDDCGGSLPIEAPAAVFHPSFHSTLLSQ